MDYHVFILSRVREAVRPRHDAPRTPCRTAIKSTAGVVTSAAVVMVGVFAIFGTLSFMLFKQMGVGLAFAVLLDATLIRGVLLPASMKLLGERNWWLPKPLGWLPDDQARGRGGARQGLDRTDTRTPGARPLAGAGRSGGVDADVVHVRSGDRP